MSAKRLVLAQRPLALHRLPLQHNSFDIQLRLFKPTYSPYAISHRHILGITYQGQRPSILDFLMSGQLV